MNQKEIFFCGMQHYVVEHSGLMCIIVYNVWFPFFHTVVIDRRLYAAVMNSSYPDHVCSEYTS